MNEKSREFFTTEAALPKGDEVLAMQVGEGQDIMTVLRDMAATDMERLEEHEFVAQM